MSPIRFLIIIEYSDERHLIQALEKIEKKIASPDFLSSTQNLTYERKSAIKCVTFKTQKNAHTFASFISRTTAIQKLEYSMKLIPAYATGREIISSAQETEIGAIPIDRKKYAKCQLGLSKSGFIPHDFTDSLFQDKRVITFCNDVLRLLKNESRK